MDTRARVVEKREKILASLKVSFEALGVHNPELPWGFVEGPKRPFEQHAFEARQRLRDLKRLQVLDWVISSWKFINVEVNRDDTDQDVNCGSWVGFFQLPIRYG